MLSLKQRLDKAAKAGALSTADLAVLFESSYATLKSYRQGIRPHEARRHQLEQRLSWLEKVLKTDPRLPVPLSIRAYERKQYILDILGDIRGGRRNQ